MCRKCTDNGNCGAPSTMRDGHCRSRRIRLCRLLSHARTVREQRDGNPELVGQGAAAASRSPSESLHQATYSDGRHPGMPFADVSTTARSTHTGSHSRESTASYASSASPCLRRPVWQHYRSVRRRTCRWAHDILKSGECNCNTTATAKFQGTQGYTRRSTGD
jgi:hypothetical protein